MTLTSDQVFLSGLDVFDGVIRQLDDAQWEAPSACEGWNNRDVLGHLGTAMGMGISLLKGEQPTWPKADRPADLIEGAPVDYWEGLAAEVRGLVDEADLDLVMDTPMGPKTVADRLAFPAVDLYVHVWDIGHSVGIEVTIPSDVIEFTHGYIDPIPTEMMRSGSVFGPEVEAPVDATPMEAFLAWTGRPPR